jgi:hypothetical protein
MAPGVSARGEPDAVAEGDGEGGADGAAGDEGNGDDEGAVDGDADGAPSVTMARKPAYAPPDTKVEFTVKVREGDVITRSAGRYMPPQVAVADEKSVAPELSVAVRTELPPQ